MIDLNHVTREELYEAVWAESVHSLSAKLGISDVGLAKIAHRLKVPIPGRGHWARGPMSRKLLQEPLPEPDRQTPAFYSTSQITGGEQRRMDEEARQRLTELGMVIPTVAPREHGAPLSPELEASRPFLVAAGLDSQEIRLKKVCADVAVTPEQVDRALGILQSISEALSRAGLVLELTPPDPRNRDVYGYEAPRCSQTGVLILETFLTICVREAYNLIELPPPPPPPPPPEEPKRRRRWAPDPLPPEPPELEYRKEGTGSLSLMIVTPSRHWSTRRLWRDTQKHRLEDHLNDVLFTLCVIAGQRHTSAIEAEKRAVVEAEKQARREAEAERQRMRATRVHDLGSRMHDFEEAVRIRDFLARVPGTAKEDPDLAAWMAWAEGLAQDLEEKAFDSILELRQPPAERPTYGYRQEAWVEDRLRSEVDLWQRRYIFGRR